MLSEPAYDDGVVPRPVDEVEVDDTGVLDLMGSVPSLLESAACFLNPSACLSKWLALAFISTCSVFVTADLIARKANSAASIASFRLSSDVVARASRSSSSLHSIVSHASISEIM